VPYQIRDELPDSVRSSLPGHAQDIYLAAYNNALEQYQDPEKRRGDVSLEEVAHKVAWAAVKNEYIKNKRTGMWEKK